MFNLITSLYPSIQFVIEKEMDKKIDYMDISICRKEGGIETSVCRKRLSNIIPYEANVSWAHRKSGLRAHIDRAIALCNTEQGLEKERAAIQELAKRHGYSNRVVENIYTQAYIRKGKNMLGNGDANQKR